MNTEIVSCLPCLKVVVKSATNKARQGKIHKFCKNENGEIVCPYSCEFVSKKGSTMSEHITRKHADEAGRKVNPYECSHCSEKFVAKTHLLHHISNHHEVSYVKCPDLECKYKGKNKSVVAIHYVKKHMVLSDFVVENCDDKSCCLTCSQSFNKNAVTYHVSACNPKSPFFKETAKKYKI